MKRPEVWLSEYTVSRMVAQGVTNGDLSKIHELATMARAALVLLEEVGAWRIPANSELDRQHRSERIGTARARTDALLAADGKGGEDGK